MPKKNSAIVIYFAHEAYKQLVPYPAIIGHNGIEFICNFSNKIPMRGRMLMYLQSQANALCCKFHLPLNTNFKVVFVG